MVSSGLGDATSAQKGFPQEQGSSHLRMGQTIVAENWMFNTTTGLIVWVNWSLKPMHLNSNGYWAQHATFAPCLTQAAASSSAKRCAGVEV